VKTPFYTLATVHAFFYDHYFIYIFYWKTVVLVCLYYFMLLKWELQNTVNKKSLCTRRHIKLCNYKS